MNEYCTDLHENSFEFKWRIKKFLLYTERVEVNNLPIKLKSGSFSAGDNGNTKWYIKVHIYKHNHPRQQQFQISAVCEKVIKKPQILIWDTWLFIETNGERILLNHHLYNVTHNWDLNYYLGDELLETANINNHDDDLVIIFKVKVIDDDTITFPGDSFIPKVINRNLSSDFGKLLETEQFNDVTFSLGDDKKIKAHKVILTARSSVFAAMFEDPKMKEDKDCIVDIDDIDFDVFEAMLQYIYTNKVSNLDNVASKLLDVADRYKLEELKEMCGVTILKKIIIENAAESLVFADRHNLKQLVESIQNFINTYILDVMKTDAYKNMEHDNPQLANIIYRTSLLNLDSIKKK